VQFLGKAVGFLSTPVGVGVIFPGDRNHRDMLLVTNVFVVLNNIKIIGHIKNTVNQNIKYMQL
jgi:hypothetical protein